MMAIIAIVAGCTVKPQDAHVPDYSGPTVTDYLTDGFQEAPGAYLLAAQL